jgi:hypothetical protein
MGGSAGLSTCRPVSTAEYYYVMALQHRVPPCRLKLTVQARNIKSLLRRSLMHPALVLALFVSSHCLLSMSFSPLAPWRLATHHGIHTSSLSLLGRSQSPQAGRVLGCWPCSSTAAASRPRATCRLPHSPARSPPTFLTLWSTPSFANHLAMMRQRRRRRRQRVCPPLTTTLSRRRGATVRPTKALVVEDVVVLVPPKMMQSRSHCALSRDDFDAGTAPMQADNW